MLSALDQPGDRSPAAESLGKALAGQPSRENNALVVKLPLTR